MMKCVDYLELVLTGVKNNIVIFKIDFVNMNKPYIHI